jgi:hypothetical protein
MRPIITRPRPTPRGVSRPRWRHRNPRGTRIQPC